MSDQTLEAFPVEMVPLDSIHPHPRNYKAHPQAQLAHIAASLQEHGFYRPIVVAEDWTILAGHGVVAAARLLGMETVPVRRLPLAPDDPRALKVMAGDNEISNLAAVDDRALAAILQSIQADDTLGLLGTGFDDATLALLLQTNLAGDQPAPPDRPTDVYTSKIQIPNYQPSDQAPPLNDLFNLTKTNQLLARIDQAQGLSQAEKDFLRLAAQRHTVFHYNKIADFYVQASEQVQELMEESALVIIDFDRAVELGFVELTKRIAAMVEEDYPDE